MLNILNNRAIADRYYLLSHLFNRYANRAKNIKNHARVNEDPKDAMIRNLENEIELLRLCQGHANIVKLHEVFNDEVSGNLFKNRFF